jgi:hypothetical protein
MGLKINNCNCPPMSEGKIKKMFVCSVDEKVNKGKFYEVKHSVENGIVVSDIQTYILKLP